MYKTNLTVETATTRLVRRDHYIPDLPSTDRAFVEWESGNKQYVSRVDFPDEPVSRPNYPEARDPIVITFRDKLSDADRAYYLTRGWEEAP